jgi:Lrp/AsnC family transcriptional regulator for asnA, asnC and gidA
MYALMIKIDNVDAQIVKMLGSNANLSSSKLAKQLNISSANVRRRLNKLIKSDMVKIVGAIDPYKYGFTVPVIIGLDVEHKKINVVTEMLAARTEIVWISTSTGRFDVIALALFKSNDELSDFLTKYLQKLQGIRDSESFICLNMMKKPLIVYNL